MRTPCWVYFCLSFVVWCLFGCVAVYKTTNWCLEFQAQSYWVWQHGQTKRGSSLHCQKSHRFLEMFWIMNWIDHRFKWQFNVRNCWHFWHLFWFLGDSLFLILAFALLLAVQSVFTEKRQRNLSALSVANYITRAFLQDFFFPSWAFKMPKGYNLWLEQTKQLQNC